MLEGLTKQKKLEKGKKLFSKARMKDSPWQRGAIEDFNFRDGDQWNAEDVQILKEELRPVLTFNLTKSSIDLIMGMNEDNRIKFRASPVETTDGFLAEVLNDLIDWINETEDFEAEEDSAFESAIICGRGWVALDFIPDPNRFGEIKMTMVAVPVGEVCFDPAARQPNMKDAGYVCWDRWFSKEDFKMRWPKYSNKKIEEMMKDTGLPAPLASGVDAAESGFDDASDDPSDADYDRPMDFEYFDQKENMIRVVHMEYWENYKRYFVFNPEGGMFEEVMEAPTKEIKAAFFEEFGEKMTVETLTDKRVKWFQFNGDEILYDDLSPSPYSGFSLQPVTAYRDVSMRTANHFGVIKLMKDPQIEVNKRWSQALNMLNQQVQPGIYAETDAFVDDKQAEQSMKEAGAITWVNSGALTSGKIQERTVPVFPNAPMQMEQFSQDIMKKITGINPDLLGQDRGRQEPGVVVRLRQQQGITLLKPLFKNVNNMKKELFKRQMAIIMQYMPDRQILRILGQNDRYQIDKQTGAVYDKILNLTAHIRDIRDLDYNIIAEPSPGNMTKRMLELTALIEMSERFPVPPDQIIEKMEIPESDKQRWLEYIKQQQEAQSQKEQEMLSTQVSMEDRKIKVDETKNILDFAVDIAKIKQMAEKDEKKLVSDFAKLSVQEQANVLQFAAETAKVVASVSDKEGESNEQKTK